MAASIWSADRFLVGVGRIGGLDECPRWCHARGICPWATGEEPDWHRQPVDWDVVDRTWPDPHVSMRSQARAA